RVHRLSETQARGRGRAAAHPHGARRRLRPARAVSLRGRIALVGGIAVAVAVAGVAVGSYAAVRSQLRGEIDNSLRDRAHFYEKRPEDGERGGGGPRDQGGGPGGPPPPDQLSPHREPAYGGAAGYV